MRPTLFLLLLFLASKALAQTPKVQELPEFVFIPFSSDEYRWERVMLEKGRTLFNNAIACTDDEVYSFGGFNRVRVQRQMNRLAGKRLVKDSIVYPGQGFMNNLFFIRDSLMFIGGGLDSGMGRYTYKDFWQYNQNTGAWKRLNDLPFYYHHALNVLNENGRTIILAATLQGARLDEQAPQVYEYLPQSDTWKITSKELPAAALLHSHDTVIRFAIYPTSFRIDDFIYVFFQLWHEDANAFFRFSLRDGGWTELKPFPGSGKWLKFAFATSDGMYGYMGGGMRSVADNSKTVFRYDPEREKWEQIASLPRGVRWAKGWRFKGECYVGFGINDKDLTVMAWKLKRRK